MIRTLRWAGAVAMTALALAGCVRTTVDTTIAADDTFSQHIIVAFTDDVAAQLSQQAGEDFPDMIGDIESSPELTALQEKYPDQVEIAPFTDGDLEGMELTFTDLPLDEFNSAGGSGVGGMEAPATVTRVDDQFVLEFAGPEGLDLDAMGLSEGQLGLFESSTDIALTYTFPGPIREASVGEIDGHTVTVGLSDLLSGEDIRIVADANDSIDWTPILRWGGIALALVLVVGGAIALIVQDRRKHRRSTLPPPVTTADPHGPGMLAGPYPGEGQAPDDERIGDGPDGDDDRPDRSS